MVQQHKNERNSFLVISLRGLKMSISCRSYRSVASHATLVPALVQAADSFDARHKIVATNNQSKTAQSVLHASSNARESCPGH